MTQVLPAPFFKINGLHQPSAGAGRDLLGPISETSAMVRPRIGGGKKRTKKHRHSSRKVTKVPNYKKTQRKKGGFIPSIGEGFATLAGKYITPIALYGLYRFINGPSSKKTRKTRRHRK